MPKVLNKISMRQWIAPYNEEKEVFTINGPNVTCIICGSKEFACKKKNHVVSHCNSGELAFR